jgi:hypothetical protein
VRCLAAPLMVLALALPAQAQERPAAGGWFSASSNPAAYEMGVDRKTKFRGRGSGFVRARTEGAQGFGTLMQIFKATDFRAKRLRLTAIVRTEQAVLAGIFMRIDLPDRREGAYDNMGDRPIRGTTPWMRYSVVLDVPAEATEVAIGLLLAGGGTAWVDDVKLQVVDQTVPVTGLPPPDFPEHPTNLDFEDEPRSPDSAGKSVSERAFVPPTREREKTAPATRGE